jgi:hypothetical protein
MAEVLKIAHALTGILFVGGLVGRWIVLGLAERADTITSMRTLTRAAGPFERIVIQGGGLMAGLGVVTALAQGRPFLGPLQGASVDWLFVSILLLLSVQPLVPLVFLPKGRVFAAALEDAANRDEVTPTLRAAWRDPLVRAAHVYELVIVTVVLVLMIAKPF